MTQSLSIFYAFLRRDFYNAWKTTKDIAFNWAILVPVMYVCMNGYIQPGVMLGKTSQLNMVMFIGSILLSVQVLSFKASIELLFDLLGDRFIDYQLTLLSPRLIIIERIFFATCYTFALLLPYYPMSKLLLGDLFNTQATSWPAVILVLTASAFLISAYNIFICCILNAPHELRKVWVRINNPLFMLGGFWAPWYVVMKASPILGYLSLANPFMYMSEGLRSAFLGTPDFFPVPLCVAVLLGLGCVFTFLALRQFKRRVDHI